ncbi:MAG: hypothetical protein P3W96_012720 [Halomonas sp.]|jgi:hypothetical protein|nr:hypothetical protein [Halomonas sp.]MDM7482853.1 hypothetical protein [Halomonas sp.]
MQLRQRVQKMLAADDRFDARIGVVKSALALAGTLTDRQPHRAALAEYERLKAQGELSGVQALGLVRAA